MNERIDVVKLLIQNDDGEFVMLKKSSDYDWMADKWEQPGGKIEDGEDRFDAAKREVREETGLNLESVEDLVRLEIENEKLVNCYVMYADRFSGDVSIDEEHQDFQWVNKEEAIKLDWHRDASYIIPVLRYLKAYRDSEKNYGSGEEIDVVKLLIKNEEGKFLAMEKTSQEKIHSGHSYTLYGRMAGKWELPGGTYEKDEDWLEASKREAKEEVGVELGEIQKVVREEIEEKNDVNVLIVLCDGWKGVINLSKEHQDFRWVTPEEYRDINWHQDAGYGYPPMKFLESYLEG